MKCRIITDSPIKCPSNNDKAASALSKYEDYTQTDEAVGLDGSLQQEQDSDSDTAPVKNQVLLSSLNKPSSKQIKPQQIICETEHFSLQKDFAEKLDPKELNHISYG